MTLMTVITRKIIEEQIDDLEQIDLKIDKNLDIPIVNDDQ